MSKKLVVYFSASGVTAGLAANLAEAIGADLFEICPEVPYTDADLDWRDSTSRSSIEMKDLAFRPAIVPKKVEMEQYDTIYVGFPIWWYIAPTIINTFLEGYDFNGKKIIPFATSGSSGMGKTNEKLLPSCKGAILIEGKRWAPDASKQELAAWAAEVEK